jgi:DNA polymerase-1
MNLQLVADLPITTDYQIVLGAAVNDVDPEEKIESWQHIEDPSKLDYHDPVLLLGARPTWLEGFGGPVIEAPSARATLNTAGGMTKLRHALRLALRGEDYTEPKRIVFNVIDYVGPDDCCLPTALPDDILDVDIEVSGDIRVDEPEDTDLLSVSVSFGADVEGDDAIFCMVWNIEALKIPVWRQYLVHLLTNWKLSTHNGKFDLRWVNNEFDLRLYPDEDSLLLHHAIYPGAAEHGLKPLAQRIFGAPEWEADLKKYTKGKAHYERIPQDVLVDYNAWDTYWTRRLRHREMELADDDALRLYRKHTLPASHMLQDVEQFGFEVDVEYGHELGILLGDEADALEHKLSSFVKNPRSVPQVQAALNKLGVATSSTNEDTLNMALMQGALSMSETQYADLEFFVTNLLDYRSVAKNKSTYVDSVLRKVRNGRVHPTFLVHGTVTGRLSSSGPNIQNIPNDVEGHPSMRRMYIAPDGFVLIGADYKQAELRTMAELSNDALMIGDLQEFSDDFFDNLLPHVFPDVDFSKLSKDQRKPYRLKLKRIVYGLSYGLQATTVAHMLTMEGAPTSVLEAQLIELRYLGRYAGLREWRTETVRRVFRGDELITPFGRRFQQDVITGTTRNRVQNQAWAFQPQAIASDICVRAAMKVHRILEDNYGRNVKSGTGLTALVHDAQYAQCRAEDAADVQSIIETEMRAAAKTVFERVPFLTDGHSSKYWNEC